MKINEFLNESDNEKLDELLGIGTALGLAARGIGALTRGSTTGKQAIQAVGNTVAPTKFSSTRSATRMLRSAGIDTNDWLNSTWRNLLARQIQRKGMKAFKASQAAAYENGKIAANLVSDLGLKVVGLATLAYDLTSYYLARQAIQETYANDPDRLNHELNSLNVSTVASLFLPRVAGTVLKMSSKGIAAIIGKVAGPKAGAITKFWGGIVAKSGEAAAMAIFRTDAGKQWLAQALAHVTLGIDSADGVITAFGNLLGAGAKMVTGIANTALGGSDDDPNLFTIGLSGKWLPSELKGTADASQTG